MYCNHCFPFPAEINIGETLMLLYWVQEQGAKEVRESYDKLAVKAAAYIACGVCDNRYPFGVSVIE